MDIELTPEDVAESWRAAANTPVLSLTRAPPTQCITIFLSADGAPTTRCGLPDGHEGPHKTERLLAAEAKCEPTKYPPAAEMLAKMKKAISNTRAELRYDLERLRPGQMYEVKTVDALDRKVVVFMEGMAGNRVALCENMGDPTAPWPARDADQLYAYLFMRGFKMPYRIEEYR